MRTISRPRAAVAALVAFLLAIANIFLSLQTASPATATESPRLNYQVTEVLPGGKAQVQVTGTGYNPAQGIYVFVCDDIQLPSNLFQHAMSCRDGSIRVSAAGSEKAPAFAADGSFTASTTISLPQDGSKALFTTADHTAMADRTQDAKAVLASHPYLSVAHATTATADKLQATVQLKDFMTPNGVYAAVVEAGQVSSLSQSNLGLAATYVVPAQFNAGAATVNLEITKDKLDRSKQYELVVWKAHSMPDSDTIYSQTPLVVSSATWDALFGSAEPSTPPTPAEPGEPVTPEKPETPGTGVTPALSYSIARTLPGNKAEVLVKGSGYNPNQAIYVYVCGDVQLPTDLFKHALPCRTGAKMIAASSESGPSTKFAADGSFQVSMEISLPQDGSKAIFTAADRSAPNDRTQDAKVLLQKQDAPAVQSTASAGETSDTPAKPALVVNTSISNITYENGVYVSLVDKGQAEKLTKENLGYAADWVMPARFTAGNASSKLVIPANKLDRKKEYEVVVWKGHTMPSADTIYSVQPLQVSSAVWDKILGAEEPEQPGTPETPEQPDNPTAPSAVSTAEAGKTADTKPEPALVVTTKLNNITYKDGVYVAVAEKGQGKHLTKENFGVAVEWVMPNRFEDGKATSKLVIPANKLDRKKEYEVVVWKGHTMPSSDTIYSVQPLQVNEKVWDAIFAKDNGGTPATPTTPSTPSTPKPQPAAAAGSLVWGISGHFVAYTTCVNAQAYNLGHCAGGQINTYGVGAGYTFPQVSTEGWNKETHTGTVHYAGTVQFKGYGMTMFQVVNPTIVVHNAQSATLYTGNNTQFGAASYQLDLSQARKTVGAGGDVTWSGVVVLGGMSAGEGRSILFDNLTFTVGDAAHVSYGATTAGTNRGAGAPSRTPAAKPTVGGDITVLTKAEKIVTGGRIEVSAGGFQPGESGIMVVLYSEPTVLAENLRADENGRVHWAGMLPAGLTGKHTITLQGSVMVGKEITILTTEKKAVEKSAAKQKTKSSSAAPAPATVSTPQAQGNDTVIWWVAAGVLVAAAAAGLVVLAAKRRKQAGE